MTWKVGKHPQFARLSTTQYCLGISLHRMKCMQQQTVVPIRIDTAKPHSQHMLDWRRQSSQHLPQRAIKLCSILSRANKGWGPEARFG